MRRRGQPLLLRLALLLCAARPLLARTLVMFKVHTPTAGVLKRLCSLPKNDDAAPDWHWFVSYYPRPASGAAAGNATAAPPPPSDVSTWCASGLAPPVFALTEAHLTTLVGEEFGGVVHRKARVLRSAVELAFHALHRTHFDYDHLWVIEQDTAWQGSVFKGLSHMAHDPSDYLCNGPLWTRPEEQAGDAWGLRDLRVPGPRHPEGLGDNGTLTQCFTPLARYSRRLLDVLVDDFFLRGVAVHADEFAPTVCLGQRGNFTAAAPCTVRNYKELAGFLFNRSHFECCARYVHSNWWKYDPHATPAFHHPIQEAEDERPPIKEGDEGPPW